MSILDDEQRAYLLSMLRDLRSKGTWIAFDSNYRPAGWPNAAVARRAFTEMAGIVDIALPTFADELVLFGDSDSDSCARRLHGFGIPEAAVKTGRKGCLVSAAGSAVEVKPERVLKPVDTTAAGDAFNAGYIASRLNGIEPVQAAQQGNRLAAAVIMHPGAIIPRDAMPVD
jgi:2-dehydro-3-deoxygluconokinase